MYLERRVLPKLVPDNDYQSAPLSSNPRPFDLYSLFLMAMLTPESAQRGKYCQKLRRHYELWPLE